MSTAAMRDQVLAKIEELAPLIRRHSDDSERQRHLADPIVDAFRDAGIYRILTPVELGGLGADLLTFHMAVEAIAAVDGSAGWCAFINGGGPLTGAFLPPEPARTIYGQQDALTSGTVFPFGRAELADGGVRVSGRWPYASGSWHSSWHFAFCNLFEPSSADALTHSNGAPIVVVPHMPRTQVKLIDTWEVSGMAGTGSHDVEVSDLFVAEEFIWRVGAPPKCEHYEGPLTKMPFFSAFVWPIASVALGIARGALRFQEANLSNKRDIRTGQALKEQQLFQMQYAQTMARTEAARSWHYKCQQLLWDKAVAGESPSLQDRATAMLAATYATHEAAAAVEIAYRTGGASANMRSNHLQRALRDVNAATQHAAAATSQFPAAGSMLLGLPPQNPMILV